MHFLQHLPHFIGLERLDASEIRLTQSVITTLCGLPALRELCLYMPSALARSEGRPFPNVHRLELLDGFPFPTTHDIVAFCNKFPNLRALASSAGYGGLLRDLTRAEESSIFPVLQEYTGTLRNLHIFARRSTLTHITLVDGFLFSRLVAELQGVAALPNITFLSLALITSESSWFDGAQIETLFTLFPNLTELQLTFMPTEPDPQILTWQINGSLDALLSLLPSTLRSISLKLDLSDYHDTRDPDLEDDFSLLFDYPHFPSLRAELMAKCPALTYILFDGYHFLFLWWKTSTSSVWEATADYYADARGPSGAT
ncbi:hypothetical protein MSAN_01247500 [Mycena sanguinolenta]|uniref:Uncharacterized protein n=1 Tax=Mycena sanguinolenta TaxID=230812 RepID=A0A8H7D2H1_9AGAR|nr:hypothetical protein MSAN_01247500 [Mycena sanguinolenta]